MLEHFEVAVKNYKEKAFYSKILESWYELLKNIFNYYTIISEYNFRIF